MLNSKQVFKYTLAALAALAIAYVLLMSLKIIVILLVAIIIASAARPLIGRLMKLRIPHGLAIIIIYGGIILSALMLAIVVLPPIVNQFADYLENDWRLANRIIAANNWFENVLSTTLGQPVVLADPENIQNMTTSLSTQLRESAPTILNDASTVLGDVILVIVMGIYWLTSRDKSIEFLTRLLSVESREKTYNALLEIEESMGSYTRGVIFVALFIGLANFIILTLLRVPNAATYGFVIGTTTMLPVVGGFIGGGVATLLALLGSPLHGLAVFATFVLVQQVEVHYLTPRMMSRSIGVDPLLVMVAVFIGFALYGVVGAIISVPLLGTIHVLLREFVIKPHQESVSPYSMEHGVPILKPPTTTETPAPAPRVLLESDKA